MTIEKLRLWTVIATDARETELLIVPKLVFTNVDGAKKAADKYAVDTILRRIASGDVEDQPVNPDVSVLEWKEDKSEGGRLVAKDDRLDMAFFIYELTIVS